jgi:hypothetical protein
MNLFVDKHLRQAPSFRIISSKCILRPLGKHMGSPVNGKAVHGEIRAVIVLRRGVNWIDIFKVIQDVSV